MLAYAVRRLLLVPPTVLGVATLVFFIMRVLPGDVAVLAAGIDASPEQVEQIRDDLNLDRSLREQYVDFVWDLARLDLGRPRFGTATVSDQVRVRLPRTALLAALAAATSATIGIPLGIIAAARKGGWVDRAIQVLSALGMSAPGFWIALMLIYLFAERWRLLPALGSTSPKGLVLPVLTLALPAVAILARMSRAMLLDVFHEDYIRTARAKGLAELAVIRRHALRNALVPVVTIVGLQVGFLLGGTVIVETIFAYPGLGLLVTESIANRDFAVVQGTVVVIATMFLVINLVVDLSYVMIDPRIRYGR